MRFLRTAGGSETGIPTLDRPSRRRFCGIGHELMPQEFGKRLLNEDRLLVPPKHIIDIGACQSVGSRSTEHLYYLIRQRIPQGITKNVLSRRFAVVPQG